MSIALGTIHLPAGTSDQVSPVFPQAGKKKKKKKKKLVGRKRKEKGGENSNTHGSIYTYISRDWARRGGGRGRGKGGGGGQVA